MGANAQTSVPLYAAGEILTAANMNISAGTGVPVFATTVTRDAAFGGTGEKTLAEGQVCYIETAPKRLQVYNGTAWIDFDSEYTAYTPTLTNVTLGNGSISGVYQRIGKMVVGGFILNFGSTTSVSGMIRMGLPFQSASETSTRFLASIGFSDTGTTTFLGQGFIGSSVSTMDMYAVNASATYANIGTATSSTIPHTWTNTDEVWGSFVYKAA